MILTRQYSCWSHFAKHNHLHSNHQLQSNYFFNQLEKLYAQLLALLLKKSGILLTITLMTQQLIHLIIWYNISFLLIFQMIESKKVSPVLYSLLALAAQKQSQAIVTGVKNVIEDCKNIATLMSQHNNDNVINAAVQTVINSSNEVKETGNIALIIHAF